MTQSELQSARVNSHLTIFTMMAVCPQQCSLILKVEYIVLFIISTTTTCQESTEEMKVRTQMQEDGLLIMK